MAKYPTTIVTRAGLDMIADSMAAGEALIFTRVKLGDGTLGDIDQTTLTDIISPKLSCPISSGETAEGQVKLRFEVTNQDLNVGFFAREIGMFAKVGAGGTEQLYAYTNGGNYVDYIPDKTSTLDVQTIDIYAVTGNAATVNIIIDNSGYITRAELDEHNTATDAHENRFSRYLPLSGGTMTGDIIFQATDTIRKINNDLYLVLMGSQIYGQGASLTLSGKDANLSQANHGDFRLLASNGTVYHELKGAPDGSLTWNNREIKSMALPSGTSILINTRPLTQYIAPANGYLVWQMSATTLEGYITCHNATSGVSTYTFAVTLNGRLYGFSNYIPARKGDVINFDSTDKTIAVAKFVYAEGEV